MLAWLWLIIFWSAVHLIRSLLHKRISPEVGLSSGPCWLFLTVPVSLKLWLPANKRTLGRIYDVGCIVAVASVYLCQALLTFWTIQAVYHILPLNQQHFNLVKRAPIPRPHTSSVPTLLIPGLTLPFDSIWSMLFGGSIAGLAHEFLGHALACSVDDVPVDAIGAFLLLFLPGAYVSLSESNLARAVPWTRLRIASAGVFVNLLLGFICWILSAKGLAVLFLVQRMTLWTDVGQQGVYVSLVDVTSPLHALISPSEMITRLDDFELSSTTSLAYPERWQSFLNGELDTQATGWCVETEWFSSLDTFCCIPHKTKVAACFASSDSTSQGCLQIEDVLLPSDRPRCTDNCSEGQTCISPAPEHPLVRIYLRDASQSPKIVMFAGTRQALAQQVDVSVLKPMFSFLPSQLLSEDFIWLFQSLNFGFFFINSLLLPKLDGSETVSAALACIEDYQIALTMQHSRKVQADMSTIGSIYSPLRLYDTCSSYNVSRS